MIYECIQSDLDRGELDPQMLQQIRQDIQDRGYAVVAGLVSQESQALLMDSVLEDALQVRANNDMTPHEKHTGRGHLQLGLRRSAPYVRADLLANPIIESIVAAVLGEGAWLGFYNGNVNMPGSTFQPLHFDRPFSWRSEEQAAKCGESWPPRATTLSCSVAFQDITVANGATEIYPGTHRETEVTKWPLGERLSNHPELVDSWGPASRMEIPAGGICFRDPRMWHRGMPNESDGVRPMIALTYHAAVGLHWRGAVVHDMAAEDIARCHADPALRVMDDGKLGDGRLVFENSAKSVFEDNPSQYGISRNARFVAKVDHTRDAHLLGGARVIQQA